MGKTDYFLTLLYITRHCYVTGAENWHGRHFWISLSWCSMPNGR